MNGSPSLLAYGVFGVGVWTLYSWALSAGNLVVLFLETRRNRRAMFSQV